MTRKGQPVWQPPDDERRDWPPTSGNAVNGLGETARRRPTPIFWHRPEREAFGEYQKRVVDRFQSVPLYKEVYANGDRGPRRPHAVAQTRAAAPAEGWTAALKAFALAHEADLVGVARLDPTWIFEGYEVPSHPYVVVFGVAMDHARLSEVPSTYENTVGQHEVAVQYNRGARVAMHTANWVRAQGFDATPHQGPWAGSLSMLPAALACGFGELGKHGSIINRQLGSSFRLAALTTDMPLDIDAPDVFGADDFCLNCQVCADACPPDAIFRAKQTVRGETKWYVDFDKCIPYFNETFGCGICIAVCPWSTPGRAPRMAAKWTERRATRVEREARQARERSEHASPERSEHVSPERSEHASPERSEHDRKD